MRPAQDILKPGLILADGAMGTYFAQSRPNQDMAPEEANLKQPDWIRQIHREYIEAGARLLRTNTFASVAIAGLEQPDKLKNMIRTGYLIAKECAGDDVFVAADLGPAYELSFEKRQAAYHLAIETFLSCSADLFIFETFSDPQDFLPFCQEIKKKAPDTVIIASFVLSPDGMTRKGLPVSQLAAIMENEASIDIWGLNCGTGPIHTAENIRQLPTQGKPLTIMPNSGYPRMENHRLVYGSEPDYFARVVSGLAGSRTRILGGCCGTTPRHIAALKQALSRNKPRYEKPTFLQEPAHPAEAHHPTPLADRLGQKLFTVVCELDPPRDAKIIPLIEAARKLKAAGVDMITLGDSPMARVRMDPVVSGARIYRETHIPVLPHLCCRDRNANALRSSLLALYSEGIRQVLAVTGDAIPESERGYLKPVFNLNSIELLRMITQMNQEQFSDEPLLAAAAVDPGANNLDAAFARACQKRDAGAALFLSQPIFDACDLALIRRMRAEGMRVFVGIMPLVSYRNAQFLNHEVPGIRIPDTIMDRFHPDQDKDDAFQTGLSIARDLASMVRPEADGLYLIAPFNRDEWIVRLMSLLSLKSN